MNLKNKNLVCEHKTQSFTIILAQHTFSNDNLTSHRTFQWKNHFFF